jgi:hypothetical protein
LAEAQAGLGGFIYPGTDSPSDLSKPLSRAIYPACRTLITLLPGMHMLPSSPRPAAQPTVGILSGVGRKLRFPDWVTKRVYLVFLIGLDLLAILSVLRYYRI